MHGPRATTFASLSTRVLPLVTGIRNLITVSGLRPLSCVIPTAFYCDFVDRFQCLGVRVLSWGACSHLSCLPLGICRFPLATWAAAQARGWWCYSPIRVGGSNRVSSSRAAGLYFGVVVVFVCFTRVSTFGACFLIFGWVLFVPVLHQKHVLPLGCIFSTDFLAPSFSQCVFFGLVF